MTPTQMHATTTTRLRYIKPRPGGLLSYGANVDEKDNDGTIQFRQMENEMTILLLEHARCRRIGRASDDTLLIPHRN